MKSKKVNFKILFIIVIAIILTLIIYICLGKVGILQKLNETIKPETPELFSYIIYDNQDEKNIKMLIEVNDEKGIEYIREPDGKTINCNGKTQVSLEYVAAKNSNLSFTVKTNGEQEISKNITLNNGKEVVVGNDKLMEEKNIQYTKCQKVGTILYVAVNNKFAGSIIIADKIKADSANAIEQLKKNNIKQVVMLTGDKKEVGESVAKELKLDKVYTELLPDQKVEKVEELIKDKSEKGKLAFVGDGINDAPVLAISDIGIAMGGVGSDAAIEAADIVIMTDEPSKIVGAMKVSKKTMRIVIQNIVFAIGIKVLVLIFSALGISTMWEAVFADVGVTFITVLNSLRVFKK